MPVHYTFEVHTPYRPFFSGRVEMIIMKLVDGEVGIYANHSPFTAPVTACTLRIKDEKGKWRHAFITDGILEVKNHKTVLIVDTAEWPEEINRERALAAKQAAEEQLKNDLMKFEKNRFTAKLRRAECRLKVLEINENFKKQPG